MGKDAAHKWEFRAYFRERAFGWRSQLPVSRIKEAVAEIKKAARADPALAADGAVLFFEKLVPAIEHVDSSSGSIGGAVNNAVAALTPIIAAAPLDFDAREALLQRLWAAYMGDGPGYLGQLGARWGDLCADPAVASRWADALMPQTVAAWAPSSDRFAYFRGSQACLGALLVAGRHQELLALLDMMPYKIWDYRRFGVRALAALGRVEEAHDYATQSQDLGDSPIPIAQACEELLLAAGRADEAYARYALVANQSGTWKAWLSAIVKKYPHKPAAEILQDLVAHRPGEEGKWFAAATSAQLFDEAIRLANLTPCSPQTLTNAARDFAQKNPAFALEAGVTAIRWMVEGYGDRLTGRDVVAAWSHTMEAARHAGRQPEALARIRALVAAETFGERFITRILGAHLGLR